MSTTADLKTVRLARRAQWQAGLASGLNPLAREQDHIAWQVLPPFAAQPEVLHSPGCGKPSDVSAAYSTGDGNNQAASIKPWLGSDASGGIWWRDREGRLHELHGAAQASAPAEVCTVPATAAWQTARRLVFARSWLYCASGQQIARYDAASLLADTYFNFDGSVLDIASDANDGLMVLLRLEAPHPAGFCLQRLCASGKLLPARHFSLTLLPDRITYLAHADVSVILSAGGDKIGIFDAAGKSYERSLANLLRADGDFRAEWLDSDRLGRFVLLGKDAGGPTLCVLCDARGDVIASVEAAGAHAAVVAGEMLYWLTDAGLLRLGQAKAETAAVQASKQAPSTDQIRGLYLTPLMHSPRKASDSGWLRAQLAAMLPAGASMHVSVLRCDDEAAATQSSTVVLDQSLTPAQRISAVTQLENWRLAARYDFGGSAASQGKVQTYEVPLFDDDAPWCRLLIELAAAPFSGLPRLETCTVLYPNISLMQYLPAIFKGASVAANRPGGDDPFLRMLVGVWESQTQGLDQAISQSGARVHPDSAPAVWLDFLARKIDCPWHNSLPIASKRRVLQAADALAQARGTRHGLNLLLTALLPTVRCEVVDVMLDHGFACLGGIGRHGVIAGSRLPTLLTGLPADAARLSRKAVLGALRLGSAAQAASRQSSEAYQRFLGQIRLILHTAPDPKLAELLPSMIASMVPASVQVHIEWRAEPQSWQLDSGLLLDDPSVGRLNQTLRLNRSTLSGKRKPQLPTGGLLPGFYLS